MTEAHRHIVYKKEEIDHFRHRDPFRQSWGENVQQMFVSTVDTPLTRVATRGVAAVVVGPLRLSPLGSHPFPAAETLLARVAAMVETGSPSPATTARDGRYAGLHFGYGENDSTPHVTTARDGRYAREVLMCIFIGEHYHDRHH